MNEDLSYGSQAAILIVADQGAPDRLEAAATHVDGRVIERIEWDALASRAAAACDVIVAEAQGVSIDRLAATLPVLATVAERADATIVIAFEEAQIDVVAGALLGTNASLLCAPDLVACIAAVALAGRDDRSTPRWRENESARLARLNAEVARIAETLARLTRGDDMRDSGAPLMVGDRSPAYGAPPATAEPIHAADVRRAIRMRRLRDAVFGAGLFEDPAWDMMLDLFAAQLERAQVSVSSLCIAAAVAPTTALRWIARLTDAGLLVREPDPFDKRRAFMALTPTAIAGMREYWAAAIRAGAVAG